MSEATLLLRHEAISASAGSGKTYRLAHRYLGLLSLGIPPERICALTFSRKAAGEIFDSVVQYLADAAATEAGAERTAGQIGVEAGREAFLKMLRVFLSRLNRLTIGTLDSFIVGVVRAFPMELGVPADFDLLDAEGAAGAELREQIMARLFDPHGVDEKVRRGFLESFKQATFGKEEKALARSMDQFIGDMAAFFREMPDADAWGHALRVWPEGAPWRRLKDAEALSQSLVERLSRSDAPESMKAAVEEVVLVAGAYGDEAALDPAVTRKAMFSRLLGAVSGTGTLELTFRRKQWTCPDAFARDLRALMRHIVSVEFDRALRQTRGLYELLSRFYSDYQHLTRRTGSLSFDDVVALLGEGDASTHFRISREAGEEHRLFVDYRLDAQLDHWLLDEFQDTSDRQWQALSNLADEILQDRSGARSFFYVGDVKQAIYGWRGGNHRLFNDILARYGEGITRVPMSKSFRSCPQIIRTVNRVFGVLPDAVPAGAADEWGGVWDPHDWADGVVPSDGFAGLVEVAPKAEDAAPSISDHFEWIASSLNDIQPLKRDLSVAVLVRTNDDGHACVDALRAKCPSMPVVHEGSAAITDSPVVLVLLSLVKFSAHPGNALAWTHLCMSPLGAVVRAMGPDGVASEVLTTLHEQGFQETLNDWSRQFSVKLDPFGRMRLGDLLNAAAEFDASGSVDVDGFVRHVENFSVRSGRQPHAVRVMTVHQSKGLGFDVVYVPFKSGSRSLNAPRLPAMLTGESREWILKTPLKAFVEADEVLSQAGSCYRDASAFDALCVLYVSLTRAKRALYLCVSPPPKSSKSLREDSLLRQQLSSEAEALSGARLLYRDGSIDWFGRVAESDAEPDRRQRAFNDLGSWIPERIKRIEPSQHDRAGRPAAALFSKTSGEVLQFGNAIHRLFEDVEWLDALDIERVVASWRSRSEESEAVLRDAEEQFRRSMQSGDLADCFRRPDGTVELWREKRFELVMDGVLVSGQFDRIVLHRSGSGGMLAAEIFDFKSNRVEREREIAHVAGFYEEQMSTYRAALSRIIDLPEAKIKTALVFTRAAKVFEVKEG